ncbi:MAG: uridine phosphorylase, partial [Oscillospiraceae bacterium]|nr:uridine phosphorylase [Oscillospiraceae bacterium]
MYHTGLSKDSLEGARFAIMPGDPFRVPKIAAHLENAKELAFNREYRSFLGELNGEKVLVCSHGIGGPSTAIAIEELHRIGIEYFIRIGTSGGMQIPVLAGDVVVVNA